MTDGKGGSSAGFRIGLLVGGVVALASFALILKLTGTTIQDKENVSGLESEARGVIKDNYFEAPNDKFLDQAAVSGMVRDLKAKFDDKFSHYFNASDLKLFTEAVGGSVNGVGLTISEVPRGIRVASVLPETPAERAGFNVGDVITAVDGHSLKGVSAEVAAARIKGPSGSTVRLEVDPEGAAKEHLVTVQRAAVRVPAVDGKILHSHGDPIAYVRFATFSDGAHGELRNQIEKLYRRGAKGLILDLRGNGGGLLNEAVLCASIFIEKGTVVSTKSRTQGDQSYDAVGGAIKPEPMVVLVNRDTASAAEILSAALQHYGLAELVGTRSYGKGTFQEVIHLDSGGALDLTIGQYLTADGVSLAGKGVQPDVKAPDDPHKPGDESLRAGLKTVTKDLR